jgi:hypothetical protein
MPIPAVFEDGRHRFVLILPLRRSNSRRCGTHRKKHRLLKGAENPAPGMNSVECACVFHFFPGHNQPSKALARFNVQIDLTPSEALRKSRVAPSE